MPSLVPVITRIQSDITPFNLWPIAVHDTGWLRLNGSMTSDEVGMAVCALVVNSCDSDEWEPPCTTTAAVDRLINLDTFYAPGGLLLHDPTSGVTVEPGCCCDLFEWRDWLRALHADHVDLGHSPTPWLEYRDDIVRVWTSDDTPVFPTAGEYVDIERAALPERLLDARKDLIGFLELLRSWADNIAPEQASRLLAALDIGLAISEPLPFPD